MITIIEGVGAIIHEGSEIPISYRIAVRKSLDRIDASGAVRTLSDGQHAALLSSNDTKLRLQDGNLVEITFLRGEIGSPAKIAINSPLPGF